MSWRKFFALYNAHLFAAEAASETEDKFFKRQKKQLISVGIYAGEDGSA